MDKNSCRVCLGERAHFFCTVGASLYWRCPDCLATFLDEKQLPDRATERSRYLHHTNNGTDPAYRQFLSKLVEPLLERLPAKQQGLDYGCGPGPALPSMLAEAGHAVWLYDPFFNDDQEALTKTYDFICCSEVVEHFHHPAEEFARLAKLLRPGGWLAIMTCFQTDDERFADWYYRRDPTHVTFYRAETFAYLAQKLGLICEIPVKDVALLRRSAGT